MDSFKVRLGRATWNFLHVLGEGFEDIDRDVKVKLIRLIMDLSDIYPCTECRLHFKAIVRKFRPRVGSGPEFRKWVSDFHNIVNKKLNKKIY